MYIRSHKRIPCIRCILIENKICTKTTKNFDLIKLLLTLILSSTSNGFGVVVVVVVDILAGFSVVVAVVVDILACMANVSKNEAQGIM